MLRNHLRTDHSQMRHLPVDRILARFYKLFPVDAEVLVDGQNTNQVEFLIDKNAEDFPVRIGADVAGLDLPVLEGIDAVNQHIQII